TRHLRRGACRFIGNLHEEIVSSLCEIRCTVVLATQGIDDNLVLQCHPTRVLSHSCALFEGAVMIRRPHRRQRTLVERRKLITFPPPSAKPCHVKTPLARYFHSAVKPCSN